MVGFCFKTGFLLSFSTTSGFIEECVDHIHIYIYTHTFGQEILARLLVLLQDPMAREQLGSRILTVGVLFLLGNNWAMILL